MQRIIEIAAPEAGVTRKDIAGGLGLKKHPALNTLIEQMVVDGWLERASIVGKNKRTAYLYRTVTHL